VGSAERTLDVQLLFLETAWDDGPSPLVAALGAAASRGVAVRVLRDPADPRNLDAEAALESEGAQVTLARPDRTTRVHNKAFVADERRALVGSINGGEAALTSNREAGLWIEDAAVAGLLSEWFDGDCLDDEAPGHGRAGGAAAIVGGLAAGLWVRRRTVR
ncbi:MAG: phospholipase D-like domain-containing protein, partial [Methanobacteriota archaeon]